MKGHHPRYRLVTSRGLGSTGADALHDTRKQVRLPPGQTLQLCRLEGAGRIVRFWMTLPVLLNRSALKDAVVRMYWDGEQSPSVEVPLGDFFGATFGRPAHLVSDRVVIAGGAYLCRFEMPFNQGALVEITNDSRRAIRDLFFQIGYYEEPQRTEPEPTLHAQFRRERCTRDGEPFEVLHARGSGWFAGMRMDVQSRAWWLEPPFREIPLPRGFGLGVLEGWETIVVDGDTVTPITGTGAEDYFSGGFYFKGAPFCTPTHGCTHRSFLTGRASAYRFHVDDPIYFNESIDVAMDHGLRNSMACDYCAVAYWYQREPHAPFPALPPVGARSFDFPLRNLLQWFILAVLPLAVLGLAAYAALRAAGLW